ncbi:astacin (peptidase family M12A) [Flavobacterium araucananum]|uniref:Peptidase metallopeptidase domain-containing protein n=1 Tax=Flavobacterium araucananum TaxID=946678 RepID=A0A227NZ96_9FLAO|nr:M12 family metallopeptidase [Flavobacterium araucananum]OXG02256.1 hypothetical protein B0A64_18470 [Flavobacterium araucananum]PWJ96415.1 astacin (peptidase family M12A) [Flavobacterium araucananum]
MKKLKFVIAAFTFIFFSCDKNNETTQNSFSSADETEICTFDLKNSQKNVTSKSSAAIINWPRWETGQIIKIKFLDGESWQHEIVKKYAAEWIKYANLKFEYVSKDQYAHIRIGFDVGSPGAWSQLGKSPGSETSSQTMRLGTLKVAKEEWAAQTILHEFGHALGLHHETQNPSANIKWNLPKVYKYYSELMGWSNEETDRWVIKKESSTNYSEYDPLSIMHYLIPSSLTTNGVGVSATYGLSSVDMHSINNWYPFTIRSIVEPEERLDYIPWTQAIKSPNGKYRLAFYSGTLSILDTNDNLIWQVGNKRYDKMSSCYLENNGNIVIKGKSSTSIGSPLVTTWTSNTSEFPGAKLHLKDDGSLVLIFNETIKWSSKSGKF